MKKRLLLLILTVSSVLAATVALADWDQAESPDFTLNTTIPEPAVIVVAVLSIACAARRKLQ